MMQHIFATPGRSQFGAPTIATAFAGTAPAAC